MKERLQKILAQAGYGSRRSCEVFIIENRVCVNGKVAELGMKADPQTDTITVDGKKIGKIDTKKIYIALNKPKYCLSDDNPDDDRLSVHKLIPMDEHLFTVGRLDFDSEGLILLTNDGDLAHKLTHPSYGHEKEYRVLVAQRPDQEQLSAWRRGIILSDGSKTAPAKVFIDEIVGTRAWLRVIMHEGKKRQIREVGTLLGLPVNRLIRVRIGTLTLGRLKPKKWRELSDKEVSLLKNSVERKKKRKFNK